jgi:hypothetical protein
VLVSRDAIDEDSTDLSSISIIDPSLPPILANPHLFCNQSTHPSNHSSQTHERQRNIWRIGHTRHTNTRQWRCSSGAGDWHRPSVFGAGARACKHAGLKDTARPRDVKWNRLPNWVGAQRLCLGIPTSFLSSLLAKRDDMSDARLGKSSTAANKRKRESPDPRRSSHKRVSPNNPSAVEHLDSNARHSAGDDDMEHSAASMDLSALTQNNGSDPSGQPNGGLGHSDAPSTAAAALNIFPTMTVPQPTELSFASSSGADGDRNLDPSFGMDSSGIQGDSDSQTYNLETLRESGSGRESKPQVGSDEWHRIRRDNHKEGTYCFLSQLSRG